MFAVGIGLVLVAGAFVWLLGGPVMPVSRNDDALGGDWRLIGPRGQAVSARDFRGRYLLIYFGYTHCPDVCPTTLLSVTDAMRRLGRRAEAVQPLFVTVDPTRDTPDALRRYVGQFGGDLIGLTGAPGQLAAMERAYFVHVSPGSPPGAGLIDHSAVLYLIGPDGRFLEPIAADASSAVIARSIAARLAGAGSSSGPA